MSWRITILFLLCVALRLAESVARAGAAQPAGKLSQQQADQLGRLEEKLDQHSHAGEFGDALKAAREMLVLLEKSLGSKHQQTMDARLEVEHWQRLAGLPAGKQKA